MFEKISKRDGTVVNFDVSKITSALEKAGEASSEFGKTEAKKLTNQVIDLAKTLDLGPLPCVENIQDAVERVLFSSSYYKTTKAYMLYREQHAQLRSISTRASVPARGLIPCSCSISSKARSLSPPIKPGRK